VQAWEPLSREEYDTVWDRFYREFAFRPSVDPLDFPGIREPYPSITWTLQRAPWTQEGEEALQRRFLVAFQACTTAEEAIYALNWQHSCYWLRPHVAFEAWAVPVLPNGDYYIFLSRDFSWGVFGHPWEWTMCGFGQQLLDALAAGELPHMLAGVVRRHE
jgi:uncharacterized protein DUF2716